VGRQARPACSPPCGSKEKSGKSQWVWGTASPNLIPFSHVHARSEPIPSFTLKNSPSITALTLITGGDAARGKNVFETACATCHLAGDLGKDVGPNLATIRQWTPEQMLINILDPNREVAPNFVGYIIETKDGRTLDGIVTAESAASLTLKRAEGLTETMLRRDIVQLTGSGLSLMPEGLETAITVEQMADLIAFLLFPP